ncbi:DNA internalization-related competence protein ComEC/Rec2 [Ornithinibacillus sp. BX22]|uniref:DNA internalization-related competence protein ComEC/Rec2 n=1 Tax=Ornithinibacillus hominis TaxID=2763055 RepID=A0A923RKC8_9BACI|nr:DNA internalization-related competence protein ComEC/Rec2 [Ornithinibacillus hominis]MBC5638779.1 DNA internalization-related competence protein ComEC/Rec2 [Ornithinibacillus hominis]
MNGNWYIAAFAVVCSALSVMFDAILFFLAFIIWLFILFKKKRLGKFPITLSLVVYLTFLLYIPPIDSLKPDTDRSDVTFSGKIIRYPVKTETMLQFDFKDDDTKDTMRVMLFNLDRQNPTIATIQSGASCQIHGDLNIPESSSNPGQFDYQAYLASNGIHYEIVINSIEDISCHGSDRLNVLYTMRENIKEYIYSKFSEETGAWILALVLGDDSLISKDITELFQRWSLSHLLAISGLHIGLVVGLLYFFTVKLQLLTIEKAQYLMMIFLPIYAFLAGGAPSVLRASSMVLLVLFLRKVKRKLMITDVISIVFIMLIIFDKYIIYHIGFQFSFLVTFAIILSKKWLLSSDSLLFQMLKLSFISQLVILPIQMIYFYNFNPLSILLNVFVVPYFTFFVIPLMFLLLLISPISFLHVFMDKLFSFVHEIFLRLLQGVDTNLFYPWWNGQFPTSYIVIYYTLLIFMLAMILRDRLTRAFAYGTLLTMLLVSLMLRPYLSPYGSVTMLDIGQGDAIVIELPFRKGVFIVDAGAAISFESMEATNRNYTRVIKPFLQFQGIYEINAIIISHEDTDHAGSVKYIVDDYRVNTIMISEYYQLEEELIHKQTQGEILRVKAGQVVEIKGKMFNILAPGVDNKGSNENSLVFSISLGGRDWLFTGDIDKETEKDIIKTFPDLSVDVLKVAHHGSNTSTDPMFISAIKPNYALISVGKNNRYGHPTRDVLETLLKEQALVLRTDQAGAIIYRYSENDGTFYQFKP